MSPLTYRTGEYQAASRFTTHATSDPLTAHYVRYAMHVVHDSPVEKNQILRRMQHLKFCSFSLTVAHDVKKSAKKKHLLCLGGNKHMIVFNLSTLRSHIPTIFFFFAKENVDIEENQKLSECICYSYTVVSALAHAPWEARKVCAFANPALKRKHVSYSKHKLIWSLHHSVR